MNSNLFSKAWQTFHYNYLKIAKLSKYSGKMFVQAHRIQVCNSRLILSVQGRKTEEMCSKFTHFAISSSRQYLWWLLSHTQNFSALLPFTIKAINFFPVFETFTIYIVSCLNIPAEQFWTLHKNRSCLLKLFSYWYLHFKV